MMKRDYLKPAMRVVFLSARVQLLTGSPVNRNSNNVGLNEEIKAGSGTARSRSFDGWDNDWDEE